MNEIQLLRDKDKKPVIEEIDLPEDKQVSASQNNDDLSNGVNNVNNSEDDDEVDIKLEDNDSGD